VQEVRIRLIGSSRRLTARGPRWYLQLSNKCDASAGSRESDRSDGVPDVAIAAPFAGKLGRNDNGTVYVVFGPRTAGTINLDALGAAGFRIDGAAPGDQAGTAVAAIKDSNGDGIGEIVVGSPRADANGRAESGSGHAIFGKANAANVDLASLGGGGKRTDGSTAAGMLGISAAGYADFNRDGHGDQLLGAPALAAGAAYSLLGSPSTATLDDTLTGTNDGDRITSGKGNDKETGKKGKDSLIGDRGKDDLSGGGGTDKINSLDGRKGEQVNCDGGKKDGVTANKGDKVNKNCERVKKK
jgi:hypothetical protein